MLVVETIAKIRRAHFVQGKSIKAICRELGVSRKVSRKVVRKVVRSGATEFSYERKVQPKPKIGPIKDTLDALLAANEARPAQVGSPRCRYSRKSAGWASQAGMTPSAGMFMTGGKRDHHRRRQPSCS
jgi:transposase-like protein